MIGGNLQGVEATYLAHKAGWEVMVIDKKPAPPASGMCDRFLQLDVTGEKELGRALDGVDLVMPALENDEALACLCRVTRDLGVPFAFDPAAYRISSSKSESNRLFSRIGIPTPRPWPECGFPAAVKPVSASGSKGVVIVHSPEEMRAMDAPLESMVLQEFVPGPSYSIEVVGSDGRYTPLQVTDLEMDEVYDCKRVTAPTTLPADLVREFERIAVDIARALDLSGLMDVEVILNDGELKTLEIDARLPSQTPTAVYWSTGLNMVQLLGELFLHPGKPIHMGPDQRGVVYEHIRASPDSLEDGGERIMSGADPLHVHPDFFGADEAITNYAAGRDRWEATMIYTGPDIQEARARREAFGSELK